MSQDKKLTFFRYAATVIIICLIAPGFLSVVFHFVDPYVLSGEFRQELKTLKEVFPQARYFKSVKDKGDIFYYRVFDSNRSLLGFAFKAAKKGYAFDIVTLAGMDTRGVIARIKILEQNDTPGYGTKVLDPRLRFQEQFSGKGIGGLKQTVDIIAGATISSRAVIDSVQARGKEIMDKVKNE